jgi:hypothetical protein
MEQAAGKHPYKRMRLTKLENLQLKENNHVICCTVQPKTIIPASQQGINLSSDPKGEKLTMDKIQDGNCSIRYYICHEHWGFYRSLYNSCNQDEGLI